MLEFQQREDSEERLYAEDTDSPLPDTLNPKTRYALFTTIATGGKSLIKSCRDLHLRRTICYKTLRPEFVNNRIENKRLLREARISALLQHPNTIPTYELGRDNRGNLYFTMKLVHGYTLREVLNYRDRYDLSQLIEVLIQVGHALDYAHSRGVLHRDIKPENILVGPYGEVLVLDWGMAKVWSKVQAEGDGDDHRNETDNDPGMTGEGKLQGTVMYMSPEQVDRDPDIGFHSDVYSLGAILYEILTGQTPFLGEIVQAVVQNIRQDAPRHPSDILKNIPAPLADLSMQCLLKRPDQRPADMSKVIQTLKDGW